MTSNFSAAPELALYVQKVVAHRAPIAALCVCQHLFLRFYLVIFSVGSTRRLGATSSF